jgi:hypothetical protein
MRDKTLWITVIVLFIITYFFILQAVLITEKLMVKTNKEVYALNARIEKLEANQ